MHCNNNAIGIEYIIWRARCITPKEGEENRNIDKLSIIGNPQQSMHLLAPRR
jgi:hypothetical protein